MLTWFTQWFRPTVQRRRAQLLVDGVWPELRSLAFRYRLVAYGSYSLIMVLLAATGVLTVAGAATWLVAGVAFSALAVTFGLQHVTFRRWYQRLRAAHILYGSAISCAEDWIVDGTDDVGRQALLNSTLEDRLGRVMQRSEAMADSMTFVFWRL